MTRIVITRRVRWVDPFASFGDDPGACVGLACMGLLMGLLIGGDAALPLDQARHAGPSWHSITVGLDLCVCALLTFLHGDLGTRGVGRIVTQFAVMASFGLGPCWFGMAGHVPDVVTTQPGWLGDPMAVAVQVACAIAGTVVGGMLARLVRTRTRTSGLAA